jgi:hypothetical protein
MRQSKFAVLVTIAALGFNTSAHTQNLKFGLPSGSEIHAAIDRLPADDQKNVRQATADTFPLFIFIPGIMGSRLIRTRPDGSTKVIWGKNQGIFASPDRELEYGENDKVEAKVMDEYFVLDTSFDVYGKAIDALRYMDLSAGGNNVRPFAYDWRQSNAKSARDLAAWFCANKDEFEKRPLVLLAHSMGGLVLKSWLKNIYDAEGCTVGEKFANWVKVKKIFFLGTPHYGAPKAVTAFADIYSILVDRDDSTLNRIIGNIDAKTMSSSINAYGATFPSAYELLPIVNTNKCFKDPGWPFPVSVKQANGVVHNDIDLFDETTWGLFKWPKILSADIDRARFVKDRLPKLLESAKSFLCDIGRFRPDLKFDVVRLSGEQRSTICSVTISQPAVGGTATVKPEFCQEGDGTVPKWIASEDRYSTADKLQFSTEGHMHLVGSSEFLRYLQSYKNELHRQMQKDFSDKVGNTEALVKLYASLHAVVPSAAGVNDPNDVTLQIARRVVIDLGIPPEQIYAAAKLETNPSARANAYRIAADVSESTSPRRAWALNNAAHIYLSQNDFVAARDLGRAAIDVASKAGAFGSISSRASATAAVAAEQLNDLTTAKTIRSLAIGPSNSR